MSLLTNFFRWFNKKDMVPTLGAIQKMIAFYHDKENDMFKLGWALPNLSNICLHKTTEAKFCSSTSTNKDLLEKIRGDVVVGPSMVFTLEAVVDEFIFESLQIYANLLWGMMLANYIPFWCVNPCPRIFIRISITIQGYVALHVEKTRHVALGNWNLFSTNKNKWQNKKLLYNRQTEKNDGFSVDGFCSQCNTVFWAIDCFYHFCPC